MHLQDAEAHLQHHFDSIQEIADSTTLPSLLPALSRALLQAADVETPLQRLRCACDGLHGPHAVHVLQPGHSLLIEALLLVLRAGRRDAKQGTVQLDHVDKLAAWEELTVAAFTRALGAVWLLPLLELFVRAQLCILGRHLYLECAVQGRWDCTTSLPVTHGTHAALYRQRRLSACCWDLASLCSNTQRHGDLPRLSAASQERFLSYAEFLAQQGATRLLGVLRRAAAPVLAEVPLGQALVPREVQGLLARVDAAFAQRAPAAFGARGWAAVLLPEPAALHESLGPSAPNDRAVLLGAEAVLVDGVVVEQLAAEAEAVASGAEFAGALQVGLARECSAAAWGMRWVARWLGARWKAAKPRADRCAGAPAGVRCGGPERCHRAADRHPGRAGAATGQGCALGVGSRRRPVGAIDTPIPGELEACSHPVGSGVRLLLLRVISTAGCKHSVRSVLALTSST